MLNVKNIEKFYNAVIDEFYTKIQDLKYEGIFLVQHPLVEKSPPATDTYITQSIVL